MNLVPGKLLNTFNSMAHGQINCHMRTCTNFVNDSNLYAGIVFTNFKCSEPSSSWHTFVRTCLDRIPAEVMQNFQIALRTYIIECTSPISVLVSKIGANRKVGLHANVAYRGFCFKCTTAAVNAISGGYDFLSFHHPDQLTIVLKVAQSFAVNNDPIMPGDFAKLQHMLGAVRGKPKNRWGYRNYFAAGSGQQHEAMQRLVAAGLAAAGRAANEMTYFHATRLGCKVAGLDGAGIKRAMED